MKTSVKVVLGIVGALVALIVALVIFLPLVFNPNAFKPQIAHQLEQRTGRQVEIPGKIQLSVFPWLGASVGKVEVANAKGFGDTPFAEVQHASVHIKLVPLVLHRRIELGTLHLDGLTLHLMRNKQGRSNWADLEKHAGKAKTKGQPSGKPAAGTAAGGSQPVARKGGFSLRSLQVAGVDIRNASATWDDAHSDTHYKVQNLLLRTGKITLGEPFKVNFRFKAESSRPAVNANVDLATQVKPDVNGQRYSFSDLRLTILAQGKGVPGGQQQLVLNGAGRVDLGAGTAEVNDLKLEAAGVTVTGNAHATHITGQPKFAGKLAAAEFSPREVMDKLGLKPPATADKKALTHAALQLAFTGNSSQLDATKVDVILDDSHLTGTAKISHFARPAIDFALNLDRINADRYLPPHAKAAATAKGGASASSSAGEPSAETPSKASVDSTELPLDTLHSLNTNGRLRIGHLQVMGAKMKDVDLTIAARNGHVQIKPLVAKLYGGQLKTNAQINATSDPTYRLDLAMNGLQAGPLMHDVMGRTWLDGVTHVQMNLDSAGQTVGDIRKALKGQIRFAFKNGAIHGFDLAQFIRQATAVLHGDKAPPAAGQKTDFSILDGTFHVHQGIFENKDLRLLSPFLRVGGEGQANMVSNTINYLVKATVVKSPQGQGGKSANDLKGVTVPLRLTGDVFSPKVRLDVEELARERLQGKQQDLEQKLKQKGEDLRQKALNQLQKLFH